MSETVFSVLFSLFIILPENKAVWNAVFHEKRGAPKERIKEESDKVYGKSGAFGTAFVPDAEIAVESAETNIRNTGDEGFPAMGWLFSSWSGLSGFNRRAVRA